MLKVFKEEGFKNSDGIIILKNIIKKITVNGYNDKKMSLKSSYYKLLANILHLQLRKYSFSITTDKKDIEETFKIRYKVFCQELGFLHASNYPNKMEQDKYDDKAVVFVVKDGNKIIGTARILLGKYGEVPTDACLSVKKMIPAGKQYGEISRFILLPEYRSKKIALGLTREINLYALSMDLDYYIITNSVIHAKRYKKFGFKIVNGPYKFKPISDKYLAVTMIYNIKKGKDDLENNFPFFNEFLKMKM